MKIFSAHRRKLEPHRRFGSTEFQIKIREAANYKRVFDMSGKKFHWGRFNFSLKIWRNLGIAALLIVFYYAAISPYFKISEVEVSGNSQVSSQAISDAIRGSSNARLFFLNSGRVNSILTSELPSIKEVVEYDRTWPNKITLKVMERNPGFAIRSNNNYFLVDDEGVVVMQIDEPENLLIVEDQVVETFARNEALPNPKLAPFVLSMNKQWQGKVSSAVTIVKFPGKGSTEVQFETSEGWSVMFDTARPVNGQLNNLALILNKQIPARDRSQLAYIDLRLNKFAYYCFKASPCQQHEQTEGAQNAE